MRKLVRRVDEAQPCVWRGHCAANAYVIVRFNGSDNAICRNHLADKLWPPDLKERAAQGRKLLDTPGDGDG